MFIISSWTIISALEFGTPKIKCFTLVTVQGQRQREKSALDLSSHEHKTLLREVPCLSSAPPLLCNKLLLRYQVQSWDSSVTTVTRPWAGVWNRGFTFTAGKSIFLSCVQTNNTVPSDGWQHLFTLCYRRLDMTITTQLHLALKFKEVWSYVPPLPHKSSCHLCCLTLHNRCIYPLPSVNELTFEK